MSSDCSGGDRTSFLTAHSWIRCSQQMHKFFFFFFATCEWSKMLIDRKAQELFWPDRLSLMEPIRTQMHTCMLALNAGMRNAVCFNAGSQQWGWADIDSAADKWLFSPDLWLMAHSYGAFPLHGTARYGSLLGGFPLGTVPGTWYFFSTTSVEVPSEPYRYQNVTCKLCWSLIGRRESSLLRHWTCDTRPSSTARPARFKSAQPAKDRTQLLFKQTHIFASTTK